MGRTFKQPIEDEKPDQDLKEIIEEGKEFFDKMTESFAEGRTLLEKKQNLNGKKPSKNPPNNAPDGGENMDIDVEDITSGLTKLRAIKGDITLSEAEEFIEENEGMVKDIIGDSL